MQHSRQDRIATVGGLTLAALDRYLADMRAWVPGNCRVALAAGTASGRIGEKPGRDGTHRGVTTFALPPR